jgi:hypothetical protein
MCVGRTHTEEEGEEIGLEKQIGLHAAPDIAAFRGATYADVC